VGGGGHFYKVVFQMMGSVPVNKRVDTQGGVARQKKVVGRVGLTFVCVVTDIYLIK
jgi:hypothetical protein